MGEKKLPVIKKTVAAIVHKLNENEISELKAWTERSLTVVNDKSLSRIDQIKALQKQNIPKQILPLLKAVFNLAKENIWENQSWARRIGSIGLLSGAVAFGSQAAGLATMGMGVAVPLALVTTTGGIVLGVLLDEVNKEVLKRKSNVPAQTGSDDGNSKV